MSFAHRSTPCGIVLQPIHKFGHSEQPFTQKNAIDFEMSFAQHPPLVTARVDQDRTRYHA
jgi:hypothetical protein